MRVVISSSRPILARQYQSFFTNLVTFPNPPNATMKDLIATLKRTPLFLSDHARMHNSFERKDIEKIIPHRAPFLLIDKITKLDVSRRLIQGERYIDENDPVFMGHFPDKPIYPGVLQIEMVAQLGLCLSYFVLNHTDQIDAQHRSVMAMITKVHHASFNMSILPKQHVVIYSQVVDFNAITGIIAGQIFLNSQINSYFIIEAYFNE